MKVSIQTALEKASALAVEGQIAKAEKIYLTVLEKKNGHPDAIAGIESLFYTEITPTHASEILERAINLTPLQLEAWAEIIKALIVNRKAEILEEYFSRQDAGINPTETITQISEASIKDIAELIKCFKHLDITNAILLKLAKSGLKEDIRSLIINEIENAVSEVDKLVRFGNILLELHLVDQANEACSEASARYPETTSLRLLKAKVMLQMKQNKEALTIAHDILSQEGKANVEAMVTFASCLSAVGQHEKAKDILDKALLRDSSKAYALQTRALVNFRIGGLQKSLEDSEFCLKLKPHVVQIWILVATIRGNCGDFSGAVNALKRASHYNSHNLNIRIFLGEALRKSGQVEEAIAVLKDTLETSSSNPNAWLTLGTCYQQKGIHEEAISAYEEALKLDPKNSTPLNNLGIIFMEQGELQKCMEVLQKGIECDPNNADIYNTFGLALQKAGSIQAAISRYKRAVELKPDFLEALNNLGVSFKEMKEFGQAEECYRKAISVNDKFIPSHVNLVEILEKRNRISDAQQALEFAKKQITGHSSELMISQLQLNYRTGDTSNFYNILEKIDENELSEARRVSYFKLKGDYYDKLGQFDSAYNAFKKMNKLAKLSSNYNAEKATEYFKLFQSCLAELQSVKTKPEAKTISKDSKYDDRISPVFLVGFPRSGTTLLDSILRSHSQIDVIEEEPMLDRAASEIKRASAISSLEDTGIEQIERARARYFKEQDKYLPDSSGSVIVDKLPLNILKLPLVARLFPQSKVILAIRHPLDSILSCWMQNFELNLSMSNMIDLNRIVDFYCVAMGIFAESKTRYNLKTTLIRYEDVVDDLEGSISNLLEFLDLEWEDKLVDFHKTASARAFIKTPSYSQVVKPIYTSSTERWMNYKDKLTPYDAKLAPWLSYFGYTGNDGG